MPNWKHGVAFVACIACVVALSGAAIAQQGPGGPQLSPEMQAKISEMQAKTIAEDLKLNPEQTTKLVAAYKSARESLAAARAKMGESRDRAAMMELMKTERTKFETAVKAFLNPEQTTRVMATLGSFNRRWDGMVATLDSFKLDEKKMAEAMKLVANYVAESSKLMETAMASGDFQSIREKLAPLKDKLDADLAKALSAEQLAKWKEETAPRGRGR